MDYIDIPSLEELRGELIDSFYLIRAHNVRQSKSGKDYIDLTLADANAEVPGKIWDVDPFRKSLKAGEIVKIRAVVEEFMGATQLNIKIIRLPQETDDIDERCLIPSAPEEGEKLYGEALSYADKIKRPQLLNLVKTLYEARRDSLLTAPAALQMHHSVRAGLLWHTVTMLRAAQALLPVYPGLDGDLLYAGILLHDLAKLEEMIQNEKGLAEEYTVDGQLLGHITQGVIMIMLEGRALGVDDELLRVLAHMVLSHHEVPEFGSPRPPMTPEAELLQTLDRLDARMYDHFLALKTVEKGCQSQRVRSLQGRRLYKPGV